MLVLPMVVLNMGGEMINILRQRLNAQFVEEDKANAVLRDVLSAMYAPEVCVRVCMCVFFFTVRKPFFLQPRSTSSTPKSVSVLMMMILHPRLRVERFCTTNYKLRHERKRNDELRNFRQDDDDDNERTALDI